jgi:hypothetical protein
MTKKMVETSGETPQYWMAFLDIKAAYDTVWREKLWEILARRGVDPAILKILQSLFDRCIAKISIKGTTSEPFWFMLGLLQGSVLSPSLFNYFIDDLPREIRHLNNTETSTLFADDIAIITKSLSQLLEILKTCEEFSNARHFKFDASKCEIIATPTAHYTEIRQIKMYRQRLTISKQFKYLGAIFDYDGFNPTLHTDHTLKKAHIRLNQLRSIGLHGRGLAPTTAIYAYKVFIRPVLEYGLAIDSFPAHERKRLHRFQIKSLKLLNTIFSTPHTTSQRALLLLTNLLPISSRNVILATKSWARMFDRAEDTNHFSSYALSLLPDLHQYKPKVFSSPLWKSLTNTVPLPTLFVSAITQRPEESTQT